MADEPVTVILSGGEPLEFAQNNPSGGAPIEFAQNKLNLGAPLTPNVGGNGSVGISPSLNANVSAPLIQNVPTALSGPPQVGFFRQTGRTLLEDGIDVHGIVFDHYLANPSAGIVTGQLNNLIVISPAVDLDLNRILGIPGGLAHIQYTLFTGRVDIPQIITQTGGFLTGFQTTPATDINVLSVATYEQRLFNNRLAIELGRSNVYRSFVLPNSLDPFTAYSSTLELDGDFNSVPYPTWSGRINYHFNKLLYLQGGVYVDDFRRSVQNSDNFGIKQSSGVQQLEELGYRSEFNNEAYPANAELGYESNTRSGYTNIKGTGNTATTRNTATNYPGGGVFFFQGQKVLWRGARPAGSFVPNIALYGAADASVGKPQPIDFDALVGVTFTGIIPIRPKDAFGFQTHYQRLSAVEANYETRLHTIFAGRGSAQSRDGFAFEGIYSAGITPWLAIRPIVEYFTNPDNLFNPTQRVRPHDGFECALFAVVPIGRLLGTSNKPF